MLSFESVIFPHDGRYFNFAPAAGQPAGAMECHVCYWRGVVRPSTTPSAYEAFVEQKYAPYGQITAENPFPTRQEALRWVATQLCGEEE